MLGPIRLPSLRYNVVATAVSFEVDSTRYEMIRNEFSIVEWLAGLGGLFSFLNLFPKIISYLDSPQLLVAQDLVKDSDN